MCSKKLKIFLTSLVLSGGLIVNNLSTTVLALDLNNPSCNSYENGNDKKTSSYEEMMLEVANSKQIDLNSLSTLTQTELTELKNKADNDTVFKTLIDELYNNGTIKSKDYIVNKSSKISGEDYQISIISFSIDKDSIIFISTDDGYSSYAMIQEKIENNGVFKLYDLQDNKLNLIDHIKYDQNSQKLSNVISIPTSKKGLSTLMSLKFPFYGKWCGPGYSGPGTPIDNIDNCCKTHDNCYGGGGNKKNCDMQLVSCLTNVGKYPKLTAKQRAAIIAMETYFMSLYSHDN
ncbi:hypothetical protein KPL35_17940 [Clostridium sp. CF011]|uniref:phospholipase A2 family protein n=2 Tax=unclassified Clostridium TaxID=2614128 RepID=UPI001C0B967E|nr:phospholipase A2 family protein [Clostridium sp. CF011]MBU3093913.1 hypothetical protein [Clostridium sp. CF011]WAG71212.1 hypothetical protein LL036_07305 [Clostridium sp. CF011]